MFAQQWGPICRNNKLWMAKSWLRRGRHKSTGHSADYHWAELTRHYTEVMLDFDQCEIRADFNHHLLLTSITRDEKRWMMSMMERVWRQTGIMSEGTRMLAEKLPILAMRIINADDGIWTKLKAVGIPEPNKPANPFSSKRVQCPRHGAKVRWFCSTKMVTNHCWRTIEPSHVWAT